MSEALQPPQGDTLGAPSADSPSKTLNCRNITQPTAPDETAALQIYYRSSFRSMKRGDTGIAHSAKCRDRIESHWLGY
jgi:hypothetical protein